MAPPDTNIEKQKRKHNPVLYWLVAAVFLFVVGALFLVASPFGPEAEDDAIPEAPAGQ